VINDGCFVTQSGVSVLVLLFENMFFSFLLVFAPFESASSLLKRYATTLVVNSSFPELDSLIVDPEKYWLANLQPHQWAW
jgi:hypothetical protein